VLGSPPAALRALPLLPTTARTVEDSRRRTQKARPRWTPFPTTDSVIVRCPCERAHALAGARLLASQLYGVTATDPATLIAAALALAAVGLLASYLPARRATQVDLVHALRQD
jgi:hypothetical protein